MNIFFYLKPTVRERHWDTYNEAKKLFDVIEVDVKPQSSINTYKKNQISLLSKIKNKIIEKIDLINYQELPNKVYKADLVYVWGSIPKTRKDYIIELDNPYVLTYYNVRAFHNKIDILREELKKAKKITFLSNSAKNHFLYYFREFEEKCFVNYPFMKRNYVNNRRETDKINFIFVGLDFERKGGLEVLEAFRRFSDEKMHLTFISNTPKFIIERFKSENITFLPPIKREKLLKEIYPKIDIFIMPSLHESFGVVLLEALSFGMGIITTNVYATPEMVKNNFNGRLLHHPFIKPTIYNNREIIDCTQKRIGEFIKSYRNNGEFYYSLYEELKNAIILAKNNYKQWQENSVKFYEERFSQEVWRKNFKRIING